MPFRTLAGWPSASQGLPVGGRFRIPKPTSRASDREKTGTAAFDPLRDIDAPPGDAAKLRLAIAIPDGARRTPKGKRFVAAAVALIERG